MEPKIRFKGFEGGWKEERLSEISSSIASGKNIDHKGPYPLYGSTGIIGTTDKPYHEGPMLLVARVGANAGFLQLVNEKCGVSDNTLIVKPKDPVTDNYLFQYFKFFNLNRFIYGSGQPLITGGMLKKMPVRYGLKEERETLIDYFTSLDSQISASTSRLASLKQMKAASLQAMFPQEGETVPKIRFKGFEGEWKTCPLYHFAKKRIEKNTKMLYNITLTNSAEFGIIDQRNFFDHEISNSENINGYYVVRDHDFVYNPRISSSAPVGPINQNKLGYTGVMSPLYLVFEINGINRDFLEIFFHTTLWHKYMFDNGNTGARFDRLAISDEDFMKMPILDIDIEEQQAIANYFTSLDRQISLQSQRLEKLKQIKSACLDKMFV